MAISGDKTINAVCNKTKCFTPTMSKTEIENAISSAKTEIQNGNVASATNADNATKVNNLEIIRDGNGVLKIGDVIIPQKKLIYEGSVSEDASYPEVSFSESVSVGDTIEIFYATTNDSYIGSAKCKITKLSQTAIIPIASSVNTNAFDSGSIIVSQSSFACIIKADSMQIEQAHGADIVVSNSSGSWAFTNIVKRTEKVANIKVYKVIE